MATLKVWAEASMLAAPADDDVIVHVNMVLADVAETEAILAAYWEGVLEETRREVGEQRAEAAAVMAEGEEGAVASSGKSKAAKRKQQKRKAQQQKKQAAEAAAAAGAVAAAGRGRGDKPRRRWRAQTRASMTGGCWWRKGSKRQSKSSSCSRTREVWRLLRLG